MGAAAMTEINSTERTRPRRRRSRAGLTSGWKVAKRHQLASVIMVAFCAARGIDGDKLRERSQKPAVVAARREYAQLCHAAGIGCIVIGKMLHMDGSTIAAYLDARVIPRTVERTRQARLKKALLAGREYETVS